MNKAIPTAIAAIVIALALYAVGVYGFATGEVWGEYAATAVYLYTYIFHPLIFFLLGRSLVRHATIEAVPLTLLIIMLVLTAIPTTFALSATLAGGGFGVESAIDIVFIVFEAAALLATIVIFGFYLRKRIKRLFTERDLISIHHFFFGTLVYFYFVRLTLVTSIIISEVE